MSKLPFFGGAGGGRGEANTLWIKYSKRLNLFFSEKANGCSDTRGASKLLQRRRLIAIFHCNFGEKHHFVWRPMRRKVICDFIPFIFCLVQKLCSESWLFCSPPSQSPNEIIKKRVAKVAGYRTSRGRISRGNYWESERKRGEHFFSRQWLLMHDWQKFRCSRFATRAGAGLRSQVIYFNHIRARLRGREKRPTHFHSAAAPGAVIKNNPFFFFYPGRWAYYYACVRYVTNVTTALPQTAAVCQRLHLTAVQTPDWAAGNPQTLNSSRGSWGRFSICDISRGTSRFLAAAVTSCQHSQTSMKRPIDWFTHQLRFHLAT